MVEVKKKRTTFKGSALEKDLAATKQSKKGQFEGSKLQQDLEGTKQSVGTVSQQTGSVSREAPATTSVSSTGIGGIVEAGLATLDPAFEFLARDPAAEAREGGVQVAGEAVALGGLPFIDVDKAGQAMGLTAQQTKAVASQIGKERVKIAAQSMIDAQLAGSWAAKLAVKFGQHKVAIGVITAGLFVGIGLMKESLSGRAFKPFVAGEEAGQSAGMVKWQSFELAQRTGDYTLFNEAMALETSVLSDEEIWGNGVKQWIPYKNSIDGIDSWRETQIAANGIWQKMANDAQNFSEETFEQTQTRMRKEKVEMETGLVDYYNQERKKMVEWEREAQVAGRNEDAAFWRKERAKQREMEKKDREAIAKFWLDYQKLKQKLQDDNRPSSLNFGLF
jgi:hypothetical protein